MKSLPLAAFLLAAVASAAAFGQVVYAPVQFQYDRQNPFYYAGDDPRVFRLATQPVAGAGLFGRVRGYQFVGSYAGRTDVHREVSHYRPQLYTDAIPGYNAFLFGLTVDDVRNEANARVPRYFVKRDLLDAAVPAGGVLVVPPTAPYVPYGEGSIEIRPYIPPPPTLILPRRLLTPSTRPAVNTPAAVAAQNPAKLKAAS